MTNNDTWRQAKYITSKGHTLDIESIDINRQGQVRFNDNYQGKMDTPKLELRSGRVGVSPYEYVKINFTDVDGKRKHYPFAIHRLVLSTFYPEGWDTDLMVDHIDRNKLNNDISNLRWATIEQNRCNASDKFTNIISPDGVNYDVSTISMASFAEQQGIGKPHSFQAMISQKGEAYGWRAVKSEEIK